MKLKHQLSLFLFMFLGFVTTFPVLSAEMPETENQWLLMRTGTDIELDSSGKNLVNKTVEYSHYYSQKASIEYEGDLVFGEEYEGLTDAIEERRSLLKTCVDENKNQSYGTKEHPNYMAVILYATGKKEGDTEPKRILSSLRVKKDTTTGKHTFSRMMASKIAIFYSNVNSINLVDEGDYTFLKVSTLTNGHDQEIINKTQKTSTGLTRLANSHTEPLALSAVLSLSPDTFIKMLGDGYSLMYYGIHLISYYDACCHCPKTVGEFAEEIRGHFTDENNIPSRKLFTFFHCVGQYEKGENFPYTLKCRLPNNHFNYFKGKIPNFQYIWIKKSEFKEKVKNIDADKYDLGSYTLLSSCNFATPPDFYIAFCYGLELSDVEPHKMHKIQYYFKEL